MDVAFVCVSYCVYSHAIQTYGGLRKIVQGFGANTDSHKCQTSGGIICLPLARLQANSIWWLSPQDICGQKNVFSPMRAEDPRFFHFTSLLTGCLLWTRWKPLLALGGAVWLSIWDLPSLSSTTYKSGVRKVGNCQHFCLGGRYILPQCGRGVSEFHGGEASGRREQLARPVCMWERENHWKA